MRFPLNAVPFLSNDDSKSPLLNLEIETEIPYGKHCGAFGVERLHDVHTGVDLYALDGASVTAMTRGLVVAVFPFTGHHAGSAWWHDTMAIAIEDDEGIWLYGEVIPCDSLSVKQVVEEGTEIARVSRVLRNDKGRPTSMLHLERYVRGTQDFAPLWNIGQPQPQSLVDPTPLLEQFDGTDRQHCRGDSKKCE